MFSNKSQERWRRLEELLIFQGGLINTFMSLVEKSHIELSESTACFGLPVPIPNYHTQACLKSFRDDSGQMLYMRRQYFLLAYCSIFKATLKAKKKSNGIWPSSFNSKNLQSLFLKRSFIYHKVMLARQPGFILLSENLKKTKVKNDKYLDYFS